MRPNMATAWNNVSICTLNSRDPTKASNVQYLFKNSYSPSGRCDVRQPRIVGLHAVGEREALGLTELLPSVPLLF